MFFSNYNDAGDDDDMKYRICTVYCCLVMIDFLLGWALRRENRMPHISHHSLMMKTRTSLETMTHWRKVHNNLMMMKVATRAGDFFL